MGKFKVGDRVRVVKRGTGGSGHGAQVGDTATLKEFTSGKFWRTDTYDFYEHEIEPAPQQLTITAGRYYRTRDGRRVGPMEVGGEAHDTGEPVIGADVEDVRRLWRVKGGKHLFDWDYLDLIAEWVDEPVTAATCVPKFKVGDRVRTKGWSRFYEIGKVSDTHIWVKLFDGTLSREATEGRDFEFEPVPSPAIVALIENGQPLPSHRPFVHPDREAATKEARRLAGKHKGQEFGVYELVGTERVAKVYEHEWQRLAAGGQKVAAIKEVRTATGFTLKGAKDAVEHWLAVEAA